ncbi:adenosine deaminase [Providencia hangzhouensis]|uniref:adenosine deaminase n=1 Tax=Providencia rettgeri TaxID=587 RepID=A0A9N8CV99_PRORE|nr:MULTISPECIES: adenosine deaminase [Providencia]MBN7841558.1 adenosine deaminase [Providencia rettgeri]MBN7853904.1 adenosine deaminase [Providencia rettgeri]MBN7864405.1 adenosine deaminase [Providencia rettgeri]MBN7872055.1 adenosine deaminase [Providencia rettgeri]MBN7898941.1 adenosine deaminase [Providencia rettgeri]
MKASLKPLSGFTQSIKTAINAMPKVELHVHLDTCLSFSYVKQAIPALTFNEFKQGFIAPTRCEDLGDFLRCIEPQLNILQTKSAIVLAVDDLFEQFKMDNVIYAEIRFAPLLHTQQGLSSREVVDITLDAVNSAVKKYEIEAGLILCTLRHFTASQSLETANLVVEYQHRGVVALDLAADEARFSLDNHEMAFKYVREHGGNVIAHAGEALGYESVIETLDILKVSRIGHGVRSIENSNTIKKLKALDVLLEVCPSCNLVCNVFDSIENHPINELKKQGVKLNINTDARTVANVTLNKEYQLLHDIFGWGIADFTECNINALQASFIEEEKKALLIKKVLNQ